MSCCSLFCGRKRFDGLGGFAANSAFVVLCHVRNDSVAHDGGGSRVNGDGGCPSGGDALLATFPLVHLGVRSGDAFDVESGCRLARQI